MWDGWADKFWAGEVKGMSGGLYVPTYIQQYYLVEAMWRVTYLFPFLRLVSGLELDCLCAESLQIAAPCILNKDASVKNLNMQAAHTQAYDLGISR